MRPRTASPGGWEFLESRIRYHTANATESPLASNGLQKIGPDVQLGPCVALRFTCKSRQNKEPTSGLEPLTYLIANAN